MLRTPSTDLEALSILERSTEKWLGDFGEAIWSRLLAASGWHYVSLAKICEGGAPLARSNHHKLILPDFDAYGDGRNVFVECKTKTQSIVYRNKRQERHGIDQRNYTHYCEIQRVSRKDCCIAITELKRERIEDSQLEWSGSLLFERIRDLLDPRSEYEETPRKVYWRRKQFRELVAGISPKELFQLANGSIQLQLPFTDILFPMKQTGLFA